MMGGSLLLPLLPPVLAADAPPPPAAAAKVRVPVAQARTTKTVQTTTAATTVPIRTVRSRTGKRSESSGTPSDGGCHVLHLPGVEIRARPRGRPTIFGSISGSSGGHDAVYAAAAAGTASKKRSASSESSLDRNSKKGARMAMERMMVQTRKEEMMIVDCPMRAIASLGGACPRS